MPSFTYKVDTDPLSAGTNNVDIPLAFVKAYKNPRVVACDVHILRGVGTGILSASLVDPNKAFGVALINHESVWQPSVGKTWTGRVPLDAFDFIRFSLLGVTLNDVGRLVMVIEHD